MSAADSPDSGHLAVPKAYKLYLDGQFVRSESGRSYPVSDSRGGFLANAAQASRKDARFAAAAAREAFGQWSQDSAHDRGQALFRVSEVMEVRRDRFVAEVAAAEGVATKRATALVDAAIERWVWYAGWTDKLATVLGAVNPVAGPYLCVTVPEPTGVVAVLAPQSSSLLGLVSVLAPVITTGSTAVVVASQNRPLPAITLSEVLATADLPGGAVNVLTGRTAEIAPWLASHGDVNALDLCGAPAAIQVELERTAAGTVKRVRSAPATEPDWTRPPDISRLRGFVETKTVWHPVGT